MANGPFIARPSARPTLRFPLSSQNEILAVRLADRLACSASGQGLFTRNFSGVGLTRVDNLSSLIEKLGWLDQCRGQSCMFLARHYLMFESEDFFLGHYLTIVKALDHFLVEIIFYIASEQTSRPSIRQADISYLFS